MGFLPPEVQTLLAAASYSTGAVFVRLGVRYSTVITAVILTQAVPTLIFGAILLLGGTPPLMAQAIFFFIIAGLIGPALGSLCRVIGYTRLGLGRTAPVIGSAPIFAILMAVLLFNERPGFFLWLGVGLIVMGMGLLSGERRRGSWRKRDLIFPLLGALLLAGSTNLRKAGLNVIPSATLGVFFSTSAAVGALLISSLFFPQGKGLRIEREALRHFIPAGLFASLGHLFFFGALCEGSVSLVIPLFQAQPLLALLATHLFLGELESVSRHLLFAALMIVGGAVLVVSFQPV